MLNDFFLEFCRNYPLATGALFGLCCVCGAWAALDLGKGRGLTWRAMLWAALPCGFLVLAGLIGEAVLGSAVVCGLAFGLLARTLLGEDRPKLPTGPWTN